MDERSENSSWERGASSAHVRRPLLSSRAVGCVVFDIETVGVDWESLDDSQRTYLQRYARTDDERQKLVENLSLWPLTGRVVVLAMLNPESGRGRVWYEKNDGRREETSSDGLFTFVGDTEAAYLAEFWSAIVRFDRFVTFNGRGFDGPFLMLRSAALGIPVSKNLCGYRYALRPHTDLLDVLSLFGAARKWNLDFACKAFGVESPKEQGMDGFSVGPFYRSGRLREIALYCRRDVEATARLFAKLEKTLLPALEEGRL
jgi:DNA polymerase elongation subunit (family B)